MTQFLRKFEASLPWKNKLLAFVVVLPLCVLLASLTGAVDRSGSFSESDFGVLTVKRDQFRKEIECKGLIEPLVSEEVRSQCYWRTPILSLVPEGTWVQEGDVVCVLDAADIEAYARSREVILIRYRGLLDNAIHDEKMQETESERLLSAAKFRLQKAEQDFIVYDEATFPEDVLDLERDIDLRNTQLMSIQDDARHAERMWSMGMIKTSVMSRSALKLANAEQRQRELQAKLNLLTEFTHPRSSLKLEYSRIHAARNVTRTQLKNGLSATNAQLTRLSWQRRVAIYEKYYKRAVDSIEACVVRAPRSGQVIYGNSWYERSRGITRIEEGKTVRREQKIFEIPDPDRMKVSVPIGEAFIYQINTGMDVVITPEGYPDVEVAGTVRTVARYPKARSRYTPGVKDYWIDVELKPQPEQLQYLAIKADVTVRFVLEDRADELLIPRDTITGIAGHNFVYVVEDDELVARKIELGSANDQQACIASGLSAGDKLVTMMTPQHKQQLREALARDLGLAED